MNEVLPMNVPRAEISSRLTLEIGLLAGRFADFLSTSLPHGDGPIGEGRQFLQTFFDGWASADVVVPKPLRSRRC
jgi:hypothetical protein